MIAQPANVSPLADKLVGIPYVHEWVEANRLEVGPSYQRRIDERWVKKIAADFDPFLLDDLLVNRSASGQLTVMDGQHRLLAIRQIGWGDQRVPCKVYDNLPAEQQAKRFNVTDVRKRLSAADKFRAALVARDPDAVMVERIVANAGFTINLTNGETDDSRVCAISELMRIHRTRRDGHLLEVLHVFASAYGTDNGPESSMLSGLSDFMTRFRDDYDRERLITSLRRLTPRSLVAEGKDARRVLGLTNREGVAFAIYKTYNLRLQEANRLPEFHVADGRRSVQKRRG